MTISITRRVLLGTAVVLGQAVTASTNRGVPADQGALQIAMAQQETTTLSIAMLDEHWTVLEPLVTAFRDASGIELDVTPLGYADLYSQISLALTQRASTFDIVFLTDAWIPQFASFLTVLDIAPEGVDALPQAVLDLGRYPEQAAMCAVPWLGETQFFALHPDWLARAGVEAIDDWDEVVVAVSRIAGDIDPQSDLAAFGMRMHAEHELVDSFLPILRGFGKTLIDAETNIPQLDTAPALAAMDVFLTLMKFSPIEGKAAGDPSNAVLFEQGQISMMANFWASDLLAARSVDTQHDAGPIATILQPAQSGIPRQALMGLWLAGIPIGSLQPDVATRFIVWLLSPELQQSLPDLGLPPVRTDTLEDASLIAMYPELAVIREMLANATSRGRSPYYPQLEHLLATELSKAVAGETSGADALKDANLALRQFLVREGVLDS